MIKKGGELGRTAVDAKLRNQPANFQQISAAVSPNLIFITQSHENEVLLFVQHQFLKRIN